MKNKTACLTSNGEKYDLTSSYMKFGYKFTGGSLKQEYINYIKNLYEKLY